MTLVERLREEARLCPHANCIHREAADAIEKAEARIVHLQSALERTTPEAINACEARLERKEVESGQGH